MGFNVEPGEYLPCKAKRSRILSTEAIFLSSLDMRYQEMSEHSMENSMNAYL